jgi:hypothetical protein
MIIKSVDAVIFNCIRLHDTTKGASDALEKLHEGTSSLKTSNLTILKSKMDLFAMRNGKTQSDIYTRLNDLALALKGYGITLALEDIIKEKKS